MGEDLSRRAWRGRVARPAAAASLVRNLAMRAIRSFPAGYNP